MLGFGHLEQVPECTADEIVPTDVVPVKSFGDPEQLGKLGGDGRFLRYE
jgi:hypothetical protein